MDRPTPLCPQSQSQPLPLCRWPTPPIPPRPGPTAHHPPPSSTPRTNGPPKTNRANALGQRPTTSQPRASEALRAPPWVPPNPSAKPQRGATTAPVRTTRARPHGLSRPYRALLMGRCVPRAALVPRLPWAGLLPGRWPCPPPREYPAARPRSHVFSCLSPALPVPSDKFPHPFSMIRYFPDTAASHNAGLSLSN